MRCSLWFEDPRRRVRGSSADVGRRLAESFGFSDAPAYDGFEHWRGADVVVATGWETVARTQLLPNASARAYLVQDYEPDFFPASAESHWAERSYAQGLHHITAGPWLAEMLRDRYGAVAEHFELGVDHDVYRPGRAERRADTIAFYARRATPRRAVPLGLLALAELHRRRPGLRIVLFGEEQPFRTSFPYLHGGVLSEPELARPLLRGHRGYRVIDDELFAHEPGDDGLRPALHRARLAERARRVRGLRCARAGALRPDRPRSDAWATCSTTRSGDTRSARPASGSWPDAPGTGRPTRSRTRSATRCEERAVPSPPLGDDPERGAGACQPGALRVRPWPAWAGRARAIPRPLAALLVVATIQVVAWMIVLPPFQGPDEDAHFAYVQHLAETGQRPDGPDGNGLVYSTEQGEAMKWADLFVLRGVIAARPGLDGGPGETLARGRDGAAGRRRARTAARMPPDRTRRSTTRSRRFPTASPRAARSSTASTWPGWPVPSSTWPRSCSCG